jgi:uncharacterized protein YceH (UPF0502 family)
MDANTRAAIAQLERVNDHILAVFTTVSEALHAADHEQTHERAARIELEKEVAELRGDVADLARKVDGLALAVETVASVQTRLHSVRVPDER